MLNGVGTIYGEIFCALTRRFQRVHFGTELCLIQIKQNPWFRHARTPHAATAAAAVKQKQYRGIGSLLLAQICRAKRCPIDGPVDSADQAGTTHDIAECDRNEIMDNPRHRNN